MCALDQSKGEHKNQHGGAAIADKGQWNANDRDQPHDHCHIHSEEEEEVECDPKDQK
jgi:hypothetical protein